MRPGINRFVAGRRIYARNNIEVVLTVRRSMSTTSNEMTIKAVFAPTDTIFDVYRKMNEKIDEIDVYKRQDVVHERVVAQQLKRRQRAAAHGCCAGSRRIAQPRVAVERRQPPHCPATCCRRAP